jgi:hypothetical protein
LEDCGIARNSEAGTSVRVDVFLEAEKNEILIFGCFCLLVKAELSQKKFEIVNSNG